MLQVQPKKRISLDDTINHIWTNIGYNITPIDHFAANRAPVILSEWVSMLKMASVPQAGCILMEELERRIPSRSLAIEAHQLMDEENNTD